MPTTPEDGPQLEMVSLLTRLSAFPYGLAVHNRDLEPQHHPNCSIEARAALDADASFTQNRSSLYVHSTLYQRSRACRLHDSTYFKLPNHFSSSTSAQKPKVVQVHKSDLSDRPPFARWQTGSELLYSILP